MVSHCQTALFATGLLPLQPPAYLYYLSDRTASLKSLQDKLLLTVSEPIVSDEYEAPRHSLTIAIVASSPVVSGSFQKRRQMRASRGYLSRTEKVHREVEARAQAV